MVEGMFVAASLKSRPLETTHLGSKSKVMEMNDSQDIGISCPADDQKLIINACEGRKDRRQSYIVPTPSIQLDPRQAEVVVGKLKFVWSGYN